jgi:hypothetical protein
MAGLDPKLSGSGPRNNRREQVTGIHRTGGVMARLDPAIYAAPVAVDRTWIAGSSPAMTTTGSAASQRRNRVPRTGQPWA